MLLENVVHKIRTQKPLHTFWIAMLLTVAISLLFSATMSFFFNGDIQLSFMVTGFVTPMVATSLIIAIILRLVELLLEAEKNTSNLLKTLRDINQRLTKEINERQLAEEEMLRHARLASLGTLAASVAHEINNPNNAIQFNADILASVWHDAQPILRKYEEEQGVYSLGGIPSDEVNETTSRLIAGTLKSSQRIKTIVENLKHMARKDTGTDGHIPVDIRSVIQSAILILQHQIKKHTDFFSVTLDDKMPWVVGNDQQLEQVFINLIQNALHSLPDRTHGVQVASHHDPEVGLVIIKIQDQGSGIPKENLNRLTEPFFTTKSSGTGLGLFITNTIIKHHQGKITFTSQTNQGTVASIRLPADYHNIRGSINETPG